MKAAIFLVDGFEEVEALTPIDLLRRASIDVDSISLFNQDSVESVHKVKVIPDKKVKEVDLLEYDAYILPGGPGYQLYSQSQLLEECLLKANEASKLICAICAAPAYLKEIKLLKNKKATVFPRMAEELKVEDITYIENEVVVDGNLITGPALGSAIEFSLEIITYLKSEEIAREIKEEIYYKSK